MPETRNENSEGATATEERSEQEQQQGPSGDGQPRDSDVVVSLSDEQFERLYGSDLEEPTDRDVENAASEEDGQPDTRVALNGDDRSGNAGARAAEGTPLVVGSDGNIRVGRRRDTDGFDAACMQTYRMISGQLSRDWQQVREAQHALALGGHYSDERQEEARERQVGGTRAPMMTDPEGEPFLPVTVENRIQELRQTYGVVRDQATTFTVDAGKVKIPNTTAELTVDAITEGSVITTKKVSFNSIELDPKKWGVIVPWTNELSDEVGAQVVRTITETVARAFARAEDESVLTADGSAEYHGLTGILNDGNVPLSRISSTEFADVAYEDLLLLPKATHEAARANARYIFQTDFEFEFARFTEPNSGYIYGNNGSGVTRAWGKPIGWTQAMPGLAESGADTVFGTFGDFRTVNMAFRDGMSATRLNEATIQDADDPSQLIHLAAQDSQAIRFTARWDVAYPFPEAFANLATAVS